VSGFTSGLVLFGILSLPFAARAEPQQTIALVAASPLPDLGPRIAEVRRELGVSFRLVESRSVRRVLETDERELPSRTKLLEALTRAHELQRRFDPAGMAMALDEGEQAAHELAPTEGDRKLLRELFVQRAVLELSRHRPAFALRAMRFAVSVDPSSQLDPDVYSPPIVDLSREIRAIRDRSQKATLRVETDPPDAELTIESRVRGRTPLEVTDLAQGPVVVWLERAGHRPRSEWVDLSVRQDLVSKLTPLDDEDRLAPLVEALRRARGDDQRPAAIAIAEALSVDAVAVVGAAPGAVAVFRRLTVGPDLSVAKAQPEPAPTLVGARWYDDGIADVAAIVGVSAIGTAATMWVLADAHARSANAATMIQDYEGERSSAGSLRIAGIATLGAGTAMLTFALIRYLLDAE
jgi:hypothetical protein